MIKKRLFFAACLQLCLAATCWADKPKLVVGIVVDQMRWDYLYRYYDQFQDNGIKRLLDDGYSCNNCLINYVPTITAIGHTSVYTGTTPAFHGICGNNFFIDGKSVYCTKDEKEQTVGSDTDKGKMSPRNLLSTTIGDQLRLHTDFRSKVVGVSYKDRAAILPAGHAANAAYWLDTKALCFVSSTYYMNELPDYVKQVNKQLSKNNELKKIGSQIGEYPLCGHLTADMAIAALKGEQLGKGESTDMLCISFSQTDLIGHKWGTRGSHTDEAYIELDKDIARLLQAFDQQVGKGNYLVFLTADHGAVHNWQFMQEHKLAAGGWDSDTLLVNAEKEVASQLGATKKVIADILDYRVFLNHQSIKQQGLDEKRVKEVLINYLRTSPNVVTAVDYEQLRISSLPERLMNMALMGYHPRRSGDILIILEPNYYQYGKWSSPTGTTHGTWTPDDAHIPLLFYGWHVNKGHTSREVHINDIAPTVCHMLRIQQPNACSGEAIQGVETAETDD